MQQNRSNSKSQSQQSQELQDLKKEISLSNLQLLSLQQKDCQFLEHISSINSRGVSAILAESSREATVFFQQNQRVLEYAANCGKTIDRFVIRATLHNLACCHQKLWDLQKCANYLQGIIYNIKESFKTQTNSFSEEFDFKNKKQWQFQQIIAYLDKKVELAVYHEQFCAVNSQIRRHAIAIQSGKIALKTLHEVCLMLRDSNQNILRKTADEHDLNMINQIINGLCSVKEQPEVQDYKDLLYSIKTLLQDKQSQAQQVNDMQKFSQVSTFSIGKLMQLLPLELSNPIQKNLAFLTFQNFSQERIINLALYLAVSFFTVGTQLRFLSSEDGEINKLSEKYLLSEVYHMWAIFITLKYVPVKTVFLGHLLGSFSNHYETDFQRIPDEDTRLILKDEQVGGSQLKFQKIQQNQQEAIELKDTQSKRGINEFAIHYENDELPSQSNINDDKKVKDSQPTPQKSSSIQRQSQPAKITKRKNNIQSQTLVHENNRKGSKSGLKNSSLTKLGNFVRNPKLKQIKDSLKVKDHKKNSSSKSRENTDRSKKGSKSKSTKSYSIQSKKVQNKCIYTNKNTRDLNTKSKETQSSRQRRKESLKTKSNHKLKTSNSTKNLSKSKGKHDNKTIKLQMNKVRKSKDS